MSYLNAGKGLKVASIKWKTDIPVPYWQNVCFLVLMCFCLVHSSPEILVSPASVNATDGNSVMFHCVVKAEEIILFVNGTRADKHDVIDKGFVQSVVNGINKTTRERSLTATASILYNNTNITCRALNTKNFDGFVYSDPAVLLVQGPLSSVGDLSYSFINSSTVNISWSPPFTLPGTSITGYNISVTNNGTTTNYFTSDSYYVLQLRDITDSPCNEINITVSGYNRLDGETESISGIYLPSVPTPDTFIAVTLEKLVESNELVNITILINVSTLCPGEYPEFVDIDVFRANNTNLVSSQENIMVTRSPNPTVSVELNLKADERYSARITFENSLGDFNITSILNFSMLSIPLLK